MNQPRVHRCPPHPEPPLPPSSPSHPSGLSQGTSFECPASCIKLVLVICKTHMRIYMFQCYSLRSSHPRPLPQSPKVCSLHLCLFCCLAHRIVRYCLSKFHIYALIYCIGVSLSDSLHSIIGSSFIHLIRTDSNVFFL